MDWSKFGATLPPSLPDRIPDTHRSQGGRSNMASNDAAAAPGSGEGGSSTADPGDPPLPLVPPPIHPAPGVDAASSPEAVTASSFTYTPCYCEENIYFLCKQLSLFGIAESEGHDLFVVFISNEEKQVPLWHQKASKRVDGLVVWDYHVICIQSRRREGDIHPIVWDLDSTLPFPLPLNRYMAETFQPLLSSYFMPNRYFRVIHAPIFLRCFASDRTHMKDHTGNWISPPPIYSPIVAEDGAVNNIDEYIQIHATDMADMTHSVDSLFTRQLGVVVNELFHRFQVVMLSRRNNFIATMKFICQSVRYVWDDFVVFGISGNENDCK
ncbi:hypothetical protein Taro_018686 [Colocasia esculenta]|uniref:Protein N-terminal glutamine amidohydrolase n=1 Tax=Colocasia esculenta TaxID=4460 RepID=A0A843URP3_COLES|nr:hypothetical protein [Colocasia esculenta]